MSKLGFKKKVTESQKADSTTSQKSMLSQEKSTKTTPSHETGQTLHFKPKEVFVRKSNYLKNTSPFISGGVSTELEPMENIGEPAY